LFGRNSLLTCPQIVPICPEKLLRLIANRDRPDSNNSDRRALIRQSLQTNDNFLRQTGWNALRLPDLPK
jgi:hypothetical protein